MLLLYFYTFISFCVVCIVEIYGFLLLLRTLLLLATDNFTVRVAYNNSPIHLYFPFLCRRFGLLRLFKGSLRFSFVLFTFFFLSQGSISCGFCRVWPLSTWDLVEKRSYWDKMGKKKESKEKPQKGCSSHSKPGFEHRPSRVNCN